MTDRRVRNALAALFLAASFPASAADEHAAHDYRADAQSLAAVVNSRYAYLDRFEGNQFRLTSKLAAEADAVHDRRSLLAFLERGIALLTDHHAITGGSFNDSWGLVPSYADLWIERDSSGYRVSDVKPGSPADGKVAPADYVTAVAGTPIETAVAAFWADLGIDNANPGQQAYAARVLLAGRRDRPRQFTLTRAATVRSVELPNLYSVRHAMGDRPPITVTRKGKVIRVAVNDSLGDSATIAAFDQAMSTLASKDRVVIDLTDTGSGGTTTVARAIMGWFVDRPKPYQMHSSPEEFRETGIARQWAEYVLPRAGKHFTGRVVIHVGRWTGSMGEGLATGFSELGIPVCGSSMAGLLGAIEDIKLERTGAVIKLPTERLMTTQGLPREQFRPRSLRDPACTIARASI